MAAAAHLFRRRTAAALAPTVALSLPLPRPALLRASDSLLHQASLAPLHRHLSTTAPLRGRPRKGVRLNRRTWSKRSTSDSAVISASYGDTAHMQNPEAGLPWQPVEEAVLPKDPAEWVNHFPTSTKGTSNRYWFKSERDMDIFLEGVGFYEHAEAALKNGKGLTVIEAYPGPGALTRKILETPGVERVIALEGEVSYIPYLQNAALADPRLHVIPDSAYRWEAYDTLGTSGLLDHLPTSETPKTEESGMNARGVLHRPNEKGKEVETTGGAMGRGWEETPPVFFIAQLPDTVHAEQLFAQLVALVPTRNWLWKYGRMPMGLMCSRDLWMRMSALPRTTERCKLGVITQTLMDSRLAIPEDTFEPRTKHFWPSIGKNGKRTLVGVRLQPRRDTLIRREGLDSLQFCLRHLFVTRKTVLERTVGGLAPNAQIILDKVDAAKNPGLPPERAITRRMCASDLTVAQWVSLADAFDRWPFRPQVLFQEDLMSIHDGKLF